MTLIFGGSYQGKLDFAIKNFRLSKKQYYDCLTEIDFSYEILNNIEQYILHLVKNNIDPVKYIKNNIDKFQDKIIIMTDISSGIVPVCPTMRKWREDTGRCMVILSKEAKEVFRLYCGIPTKLK